MYWLSGEGIKNRADQSDCRDRISGGGQYGVPECNTVLFAGRRSSPTATVRQTGSISLELRSHLQQYPHSRIKVGGRVSLAACHIVMGMVL